MNKKRVKYILFAIVLSNLLFVTVIPAVSNSALSPNFDSQTQSPDSVETNLKYKIEDTSGNPLIDEPVKKGIDLQDPSNLDYRFEYDEKTGEITIFRKIGNINVRLPYTMSLEEFLNIETRNSLISYWKQKNFENAIFQQGGGKSSIFNPNWNVGGKGFQSIFGSNVVDIKLQGMAEVSVGIKQTKLDNPTLQEKLRNTTTFDFRQKIQMNITGKIGDKLKLNVNYDTEATFDFENQIKLEFEGDEDDIIKKIEVGNVTLPLPGTLITGSQSLFGLKAEMQFGKLSVTGIFSQQKGETKVMNIEGGAMTQDFELRIDEYDHNRHFFLNNFFRSQYDQAMSTLPTPTSRININKIEVWVTNKVGNFDDSRNIIGFLDLAETQPYISNDNLWHGTGENAPSNDANNLYDEMNNQYSAVRDINQVSSIFAPLTAQDFIGGKDYEKIENARMLSPSEYTINPTLGYISLNTALNADEVLAVAYEYTYNGKVYKVGEFSTDGINSPNTLYLKLIKGTNLTPEIPEMWSLMMKNIYSIGAYNVNKEDFILDIVYENDSTGTDINYFPEGSTPDEGGIKGELFLRILNLDNLNSRGDPQPDGIFDFVQPYTIVPDNGRIIFPVLEPFGSYLKEKLNGQQDLIDKYVYQALYDSTQTTAEINADKNKYRLKGKYKSSSGSEIVLNAMNVPQGSVIVTAGGLKLVENVDYTVDYALGRVKILNTGLLESGTPIQVSLENQSLFNMQTKTLTGAHLDYKFNDNFNIGGTIMHLRERPLTKKVNIGNDPISNTIWGLNASWFTESDGITRILDKLPLIQTKETSSINFEGEFAQLIPGHPNVIATEGSAYIDDFEGTSISYDISNWTAWKLASTPQGQDNLFPEAQTIDDLSYGMNRARLAWYVIDPLFQRNMPTTPAYIKEDESQRNNHFVRAVYEKELFPDKESPYGQPTNLPVLNVAFYPDERGPYNFATEGIDENGKLTNPEERWGGIMRKIETNDFEAANIEYIEFWLMDPFVYDNNYREGNIYFNLGNVSEDILRDSRKAFEQGLPGPNEPFDVDSTNWGYIPKKQSMVNAFSNDPETRLKQDVGLNGMSSEQERNFYRKNPHPYLDIIDQLYNSGNLTENAYNNIINDPASDDYKYYRSNQYNEEKTSILDCYKKFNNPEGNSVPSQFSPENYPTAATSLPNVEDINLDNTLSENESYFQYKVKLFKGMDVENNKYIVDQRVGTNNNGDPVTWYQFKIPITHPDTAVGIIKDFKSIRFLRMFMRDFNNTTILRFATFNLVRGEWRKYNRELYNPKDNVIPDPKTEYYVSAVNIEENSDKEPVNYVLPPGVDRQIDPANPQLRQLNEQSLLVRIKDLARGDMRGIYKTFGMDVRQYRRLKMFVHAEALVDGDLEDDEISVFMRVGSDYQDNYYEYEIPVKITPPGRYNNNNTDDRYIVWPEDNQFDIPLDLFQKVKLRRNDKLREDGSGISYNDIYTYPDPDVPNNTVKIKGNPNLSNVRTILLGVKNRAAGSKSVEIWFNELRLTDFNEDGGWAANARMSVKLADIGNVSVAGKTNTIGFGSIEKKVMERALDNFSQYDISTNLEMGKLLGPNAAISVPFYFGYSKSLATPKYYPLDPDIPLDVALDNAKDQHSKDSIKFNSQNVIKRKSINLTNVKIKQKGNKTTLISPSNISATYSYNETLLHDPNTAYSQNKNHRAILGYNFAGRPKPVEPFKKSKVLKGKGLKFIRDFNFYYLPTQLSYRWEILRLYRETKLRNNTNTSNIPVTVQKDFDWNRYFDLRYNITKALKLNFRSVTNARIDEPEGIVNKETDPDGYYEWRRQIWGHIFNMGRTTAYQHNFDVSYTIPVNKLPLLDWVSANIQYRGMYNWTTASLAQANLGNVIKNSNTIQGGGMVNMTTLYNKVKYMKDLNRKYRTGRSSRPKGPKTVRFNKQNIDLEEGKPIVINHKLKTEDVSIRFFDKKGRPVKGMSKTINGNKIEFIPEITSKGSRVLITGKVTEKNNPFKIALDYTMLLVTSLKNGNVSYSQNSGTILPGYTQRSKFFGSAPGLSAPGVPFLLGWQNRDFAWKAIDNNWLTQDPNLYKPYAMTNTENFSAKATFEPFRSFRIDLNAERRYSNNMNEYYLFNSLLSEWGVYNTMERGNFSMTFNIIGTSFWNVGKTGDYQSDAFDNFLSNRIVISERLGNERAGTPDPTNGGQPYDPNPGPDGTNGYSLSSQDVMIPAFLAAYSNTDPNKIFLSSTPPLSKMRPNWRITYDGLSRIKAFKKVIKSFNISHAYRSIYSVGSYITNNNWAQDDLVSDGFSFVRNALNDFVPFFDINIITVSEQFSPLIAFNITWANSLSTKLEINRSRALSLSLTNNQLIETYSNAYVIGLGYRFDKMNLILKNKKTSSDLNLRADFSVRDNISIIRRIDEGVNQLTAGMKVTAIKVMADYALSSRFNMQLFYDTNITKPYISTTFPITNSNYGVSFRFTLTQ